MFSTPGDLLHQSTSPTWYVCCLLVLNRCSPCSQCPSRPSGLHCTSVNNLILPYSWTITVCCWSLMRFASDCEAGPLWEGRFQVIGGGPRAIRHLVCRLKVARVGTTADSDIKVTEWPVHNIQSALHVHTQHCTCWADAGTTTQSPPHANKAAWAHAWQVCALQLQECAYLAP